MLGQFWRSDVFEPMDHPYFNPIDRSGCTSSLFTSDVIERGGTSELVDLIHFLNERYADRAFNRTDFGEVQEIAATCAT